MAGLWVRSLEGMRVGELANSDTSQTLIQGFELVHLNIYPIDELLAYIKGPVLQIQNYRTSMTQGKQLGVHEECL